MTPRAKRAVQLVVALALLALALPVSNLFLGTPAGTGLTKPMPQDPGAARVAVILEQSCASCHVAGVSRPFYAQVPLVSTLIERDVTTGLRNFDLGAGFAGGGVVPEPVLAKVEYEIAHGEMPPLSYALMHWNARLDTAERRSVLAWVRDSRARQAAPGVPETAGAMVVRPIPVRLEHDPVKAALGEKLYNDKRLSADETLSCASCHDLAKGGCDNQAVSDGISGQKGGINSPTTFNAALSFVQFWDGRAPTLEAQAAGPPMNPIEMGSKGWPEIVAKLNKDAAFRTEFTNAYPQGFTPESITAAIAEYERTLLTPSSRFDRYLMGEDAALTPAEKRGYELFQSNGCATCHVGELLGGKSFERMGRHGDYFGSRGTPLTAADNGRYNVTKRESDRYSFKVPTLRNVARTHPYFHDGSKKTLREAVDAMAVYQTGEPLSDNDAGGIVSFLETLTGEYNGKRL